MTTMTHAEANEASHDEAKHDEQSDAILAEYLARLDRGEAIDLKDFCAEHPAAAAELIEFAEMAGLLEQLQGSAGQGRSIGDKSTAHALGQATLADVGVPALAGLGSSGQERPAKAGTPTGVKFGRYFLLSLLGEGSMGSVHLAYDTALDRMIALKMPRIPGVQSPAVLERFRREARASATVRHPHICPIFDVGTIDGVHYLSMAYIEGESLAQWLDRGERMPLAQVLKLVRTLAEALQEAHRHDVIHRDLKPANIMMDTAGEPIITDFGLARRLDVRETLLTQSGMLVGTLAYMPPEQLEGNAEKIGRGADIYSLGVIFYQLLAGRLPYSGGFLSVVLQIRAGEPQPPSQFQPDLLDRPDVEAVCLRMMAGKSENRFASMEEVIAAIAELQGDVVPPPIATPKLPVDVECEEPPRVISFPEPESSAAANLKPMPLQLNKQSWAMATLATLACGLMLIVAFALSGGFATPDPTLTQGSEKDRFAPAAREGTVREGEAPAEPQPVTARQEPRPPTSQPVGPEVQPTPVKVEKPLLIAAPAQLAINSRRSASAQFGVATVEVIFPAEADWEYRPDWACRITSSDNRVFYPAYQIELAKEESVGPEVQPTKSVRGKLKRLKATFLTRDEKPLHVDISYGGRPLIAQRELPLDVEAADQPALLNEWWADYSRAPREPLNEEARQIQLYLHDMLARRMHLPPAKRLPATDTSVSMLERMFEKSLGTFLGFNSVQVALGEQNEFERPAAESLNVPIPAPPRIASVPYPDPGANVPLEAIAMRVPDDCVYLRCHSLDNYLWFRELLFGWGGGLDEVVSPRRLDRQTRIRLERQLALSPDAHAQRTLKTAISDLALVFGDTCFEDGAAVGVLFQAKNEAELLALIKQQRQAALQEFADSDPQEQSVQFAGEVATLLSTSDKRLRSYHAQSNGYHLITNSKYLVQRFFECSRGERSLGKLKEFRYARSKVRLDDAQDIFLYMPDPFFQRMVGPQQQIEMGRRRRAKADVQHLELARLAARGEGLNATRVSQLTETGFLPPAFAARSDQSSAVLKRTAEDSLRGVPGTFVPVCDMDLQLATRSEVNDYYHFSNRYRGEYRMMDPVAVVASHREIAGGRQDVDLEITITPYALQTYADVQRAIATPQKQKIVGPTDGLLTLRGSLKSPSGNPFLAYAAIHDTELKFRLVDGAIEVEGYAPGDSFAGKNWQLVIDRVDSDCMQSLANLMGSQGTPLSALLTFERLIDQYVGLTNWPLALPKWRSGLQALSNLSDRKGPGWQIRAARNDLRQGPFDKEATGDTKQIRLTMRELQGSQIEPYIQAYTFLEARRASAQQTALLELTMQQFCLKPTEVSLALEHIHQAQFLCPLEGQLEFTTKGAEESQAIPQWRSNRWTAASLYDEAKTPQDYRFPFTDWLRGLDVGFSLDNQTLSADVQLTIHNRFDAKSAETREKQSVLKKTKPD